MLTLLAASSFETLVENNLALFAIGHIGLVLVLLVFFFNMSSHKAHKEPKERDEEAFDYATEDGSMFRANTVGSIPLNALKTKEEANPDAIDEPIVFNSQINDENLPIEKPEDPALSEEELMEEAGEQDETDAMVASLTSVGEEEHAIEQRRLGKIEEILNSVSDRKVILINRDESIVDINAPASELFQYQKEDIEGKKIDEIIFLEEAESKDSDSDGYQKAKAQRKDGSQFTIQVELEMADREFGIITVTLYPTESVSKQKESEKIQLEETEESPEEELTIGGESLEPEPAPEPIALPSTPAPTRTKPLPPPPRPKSQSNSLTLQSPGPMIPGGRPLDSKTIEMFSSNLSQPLQSIVQLAQLIASDEKAIPHLKKYAVAIQAKSNRMMSQIEEMSMVVSAHRSDIKVKEKPFNLGNLLSSIVDLASNTGGESKQKIHFHRGESDLIVMSDEEHFEKVISNLLNIALISVETHDIELHVSSQIVKDAPDPGKTVNFKGQDIRINSVRRLNISTQFPGDEHINRFFDASINRPDNPLVQKLQSSSSLKNHMASIRFMKELARSLGGKLKFAANEQQIGELQLEVELPSVEVAAFPS